MDKDRLPAWLFPEVKLASRPALLSLVLLMLFGLGAVLACWSTRVSPESADFDLNTDQSSPKLDITSAEASTGPSAEAFPSEADESGWLAKAPTDSGPKDTPKVREIPAPDSNDSTGAYKIPDLPEAPAAERPSAPGSPQLEPSEPATLPAPIDFDAGNLFNSSLRGDTPMIRTWKMLGYPAILAAALSTTPQLAWADDKGTNAQGTDTKMETILKDLKEDIAVIKRSLESNGLKCNVLESDLQKLTQRVAQLQKDVDSMRNLTTTKANYQPTAPSTGRILLINTWQEPITVFLNNRSYTIQPGQQNALEGFPVGDFTYEIMIRRPDTTIAQIRPQTKRNLVASETYTIHVHPR